MRLEYGGARPHDVDLLRRVADNMMGNTICALADAAAMPVQSFLTKFRPEFERHLEVGGCPAAAAGAGHAAHARPRGRHADA
jgi:NADH-quinone oxidoreductase subunit F